MLENHLLKQDRIQGLDFIKGINIILMVMFNYSVTLDYFGLIRIPSDYFYQYMVPGSIASIFIFISGVVAYLSYKKHKEKLATMYFKRGVKLLFLALLITLFTYVFVPQKTIFFGILHFFAVTSFIIPIFIKYHKLNLIAGLSIIISGIYLQQQIFNFSFIFWLGFTPLNFSTFDYFPLIPWLGFILLGIYCGKYIAGKIADMKFKNKISSIFSFIGKHSLTIYLIHQPALVLLLLAYGFKFF